MPPHTLINIDIDHDYRYRRWATYFLISSVLSQVLFDFIFVLFTNQLTKIVVAGTKYIISNEACALT